MYLVNYVTDNILRCQLHGYKKINLQSILKWYKFKFHISKEAQFAEVALIAFTSDLLSSKCP